MSTTEPRVASYRLDQPGKAARKQHAANSKAIEIILEPYKSAPVSFLGASVEKSLHEIREDDIVLEVGAVGYEIERIHRLVESLSQIIHKI